MYQGCNKTALCSQKTIAEGFYELLKEKEYSKITASEICKKSGVSRQTFYSLFSSKENIVAFILSKEYSFNPNEECKCTGHPSLSELSRGFSSFIVQKGDFIDLLEKNNIIYLMQETLYEGFSCCGGYGAVGAKQVDAGDACVAEPIDAGGAGVSEPVDAGGAGVAEPVDAGAHSCKLPPDLAVDFVASGLTTIAKHYVKNRAQISCDELEKMIYMLFSGEYFDHI